MPGPARTGRPAAENAVPHNRAGTHSLRFNLPGRQPSGPSRGRGGGQARPNARVGSAEVGLGPASTMWIAGNVAIQRSDRGTAGSRERQGDRLGLAWISVIVMGKKVPGALRDSVHCGEGSENR